MPALLVCWRMGRAETRGAPIDFEIVDSGAPAACSRRLEELEAGIL
jgi:hypothetical protein